MKMSKYLSTYLDPILQVMQVIWNRNLAKLLTFFI